MGQDLTFDRTHSTPLQGADGLRPEEIAASGLVLRGSLHDWHSFGTAEKIVAWDELVRQASEPNPFFESWFLLPSLDVFDPKGKVGIFTLEVDGRLLGLMPIKRELSYYGHALPHMRSWTHDNCFLGLPLIAKGFERAFWRALYQWADAEAGLSLFLHLAHVPATGPVHAAMIDVLTEQNRPAATVMQQERAMLQSDLGPDEYFEQSLSTKKRKELRRQLRRLEEHGRFTIERLDDASNITEWCAEFLALENRGWKGKQGSALASDMRTAQLFTRAVAGAARREKLERVTLRMNGRPLAMLASFQAQPGSFSFKTTFDEDFARFSPGVLLQKENLAVLGNKTIRWVDSCAGENHPMIDHFWRERRSIARYSIGIGGEIRRAAFARIVKFETGAMPGEVK